jgi:SOS response regulatory protein OraA/RecX
MDNPVLETALKYLDKQALTVQKLSDKLLQAGFESAVVAECVERIGAWGYLDDRLFGTDRLRTLQARLKSRKYIEADLTHSGVAQPLVDELLEAYYPEVIELDIAQRLVARKFKRQKDSQVKIGQYLLRAGFSENTVRQCFPDISST